MDETGLQIAAIIPLYNGELYIELAIRSVLSQTLTPAEIIVVDDGSTDGGAVLVERLAADYPIRLLRKENGGQSSARNFGVAHSGGDLIAFLDQDDIWYPNHLEELVKPFLERRSTRLGWVYSNVDEIDEGGKMVIRSALSEQEDMHPKRNLKSCLGHDMFILPSASLISRRAFEDIGRFDERLSGYEDDDLFLRMFRAAFDNVYIDQGLTQWRVHRHSSAWSSRMGRSRRIYAQKLVEQYPNDDFNERRFVRDLIAPRFFPQMVAEYKKSLLTGNASAIQEARDNLDFIRELLPPTRPDSTSANSFVISVIIPLYNGEKYIEEAIRSVLNQTHEPAEIIVVDDGSTDGGPDIVARLAAEHPIRLLRKENGGQSSARNFGVSQCGGDLIAFLDQDDAWYPSHLEELIKPFLEPRSGQLGWVYSDLDEIDESGGIITRSFLSGLAATHPKQNLIHCLQSDMFVLPSASLISRKAFDSVEGFDNRLSGYEDDDLFLRMFRKGFDNVFISQALSQWRIYPSSSSYTPRMAKSRSIFAKKLLGEYPDDVKRARYYTRDLLAPRFFVHMLAEYKAALVTGQPELIRTSRSDLRYIAQFLGYRYRLLVLIMLNLGPLRHSLLRVQPRLRPFYRFLLP
ncbi:MAG TPA: glycosyltransferase family 2 protein [Acetobacteraceae bacterium]|nr:glycosyltransferase family 2 protein [Acetobacteraceae bacterium]